MREEMMNVSMLHRRRCTKSERGFTLLELIVAATILSILTMMALPLARLNIKREKEKGLRRALWEMRDAIDKYEQAGERGAFQIKADSGGYPPDLGTLVKSVEAQGGKKMRFLRSVPVDPMTTVKSGGCGQCRTIRILTPGVGIRVSERTPKTSPNITRHLGTATTGQGIVSVGCNENGPTGTRHSKV